MSIYKELSIEPVINAGGTLTMLGGSLMAPEVLEAMGEASRHFVNINELHRSAGERVASLLGAEAACITSGAAAGLAVSAAACMAGCNRGRILQLPETEGLKREALVLKCHRNLYDQALLLSGARFKEVGTASFCCEEMVENGISENTAFFFYSSEAEPMRGSLGLDVIAPLMKKHGIPIIVDAAAEIPPRENVLKYLKLGADLVVFSGGKEIRGPQSSGVILGSKGLIEACDANCCPNHSIGRPMKVDKETIAGFTKAVELFAARDFDGEMIRWNAMVDTIIAALEGEKNMSAEKGYPAEPGIQPAIIPRAYVRISGLDTSLAKEKLMERQIFAGMENDRLAINPQCLGDGEVQTVIDALKSL